MAQPDLEKMPIDMLLRMALKRPIEDVYRLCSDPNSKSDRLYQLCDNEMFWNERTKQDFPDYASVKPSNISYHDYYQLLWKTWNMVDTNDEYVMKKIDNKIKDQANFIYPLPLYVIRNSNIRGDIVVKRLSETYRYLFVVKYDRKTLAGTSPPHLNEIGQNITRVDPGKLDKYVRMDYDELVRDININDASGTRKSVVDYFVISDKDYPKLIEEIRKAKYVLVGPTDKYVGFVGLSQKDSDDGSLFIQKRAESKPAPKDQSRQQLDSTAPISNNRQPKVESPRNFKNLFGFLNT